MTIKSRKKETVSISGILRVFPIPSLIGSKERLNQDASIVKLSSFFHLIIQRIIRKSNFPPHTWKDLHLKKHKWNERVTTRAEFVTAFYHNFDAYTLDDCFLTLKIRIREAA